MLPVLPASDHTVACAPPTLPTREQIVRLQSAMAQLPQVALRIEHTFGPGFYARTMFIPADTVVVGKVHATENSFILVSGTLALATDDGFVEITGPHHSVGRIGIKRAVVAITDVVCMNVHVTDETDLAKIEASVIFPEAATLEGNREELAWSGQQ